MGDILDGLVDIVLEMWDRSENEETTIEDVCLPLKAALLLIEGEEMLDHKENKKNKRTYVQKTQDKKRFRFGRTK